MSPATVYELETGRREPKPSTLRKLANALEVEVVELTKEAKKVEVVVDYEDQNGAYRSEVLRFTGAFVESQSRGGASLELYRCPGGFRVYVHDDSNQERKLCPSEVDRYTGEAQYPLYLAQELAEDWPEFGPAAGVLQIRDLD